MVLFLLSPSHPPSISLSVYLSIFVCDQHDMARCGIFVGNGDLLLFFGFLLRVACIVLDKRRAFPLLLLRLLPCLSLSLSLSVHGLHARICSMLTCVCCVIVLHVHGFVVFEHMMLVPFFVVSFFSLPLSCTRLGSLSR